MTSPNSPTEAAQAEASAPRSGPSLERTGVGAALVAAGLLLAGRAQELARLAQARRGVEQEVAEWAARTEWQQLLVEGLVMGGVAAALTFGTRGPKRVLGALLASAALLAALCGWPIAPVLETTPVDELTPLALRALAGGAALGLLAWWTDARPGARRLVGSWPVIATCLAFGLGLPCLRAIGAAESHPHFQLREVVRELATTEDAFAVDVERAGAPPQPGVLSPFKDITLTSNEFDTGDKPALLMPPPCEVSFTTEDEDVSLVAAAQIGLAISNRGFLERPGGAPSVLDKLGVESVAVRFEVLVDGRSVFDETIRHRSGETGAQREWRHVGGEQGLQLESGQRVTLRTSFGDHATAELYESHPFDVGFGDLVLERWRDQPRRRASRDAPNLLVIVMDTLRADRMSCYGYEKPTTPHLDALAARGLLFESAYSTASWTWPSTASIMTGLLPYEHGVLSNSACNLNLSYRTIAEALQDVSFSTAAISCNPLVNRATHFDQGFESFDEGVRMRMSDEVIDEVEATLARLSESRFFLYLQLVDPHTPHKPLQSELDRLGGEEPSDYPDEERFGVLTDGLDHYAGKLASGAGRDATGVTHPDRVIPLAHREWLSDRYDASVGTGDHYVGRILDKLRELGLEENTVVVFTSDHGEELLDHDGLAHGHALWRELVHVPLILAGPGLPKGTRVEAEVSNRHIAPTLAMLGGTELASGELDGNLLDPALESEDVFYQTSKGTWNGHHHLELLGRRSERYVTHYAPKGGAFGEPPGPQGDARLFDREADTYEESDLMMLPERRSDAVLEVGALNASRAAQLERRRGLSIPVGAAGNQLLQGVGYVESDADRERRDQAAQPEEPQDQ
jgi:arylsulfatase A-like enzyme